MRLENRAALVTGAGRGIGRAIADRLAGEGASVFIGDLLPENAEKAAQEIKERHGRPTGHCRVDVTDANSVRAMVDAVREAFGKIDILVNNAGFIQIKPWLLIDVDDWDKIFDVNLKGAFLCMQAVAPIMKEQRDGRIVNISSGAARGPVPNTMHYGAAKMGVISITQSAAADLGPHNIRVNAICPDIVSSTHLWDDIGAGYKQYLNKTKEQRISESVQRVPLGRPQTPEDVAATTAFLVSDDAINISGVTIDVAGGNILKP